MNLEVVIKKLDLKSLIDSYLVAHNLMGDVGVNTVGASAVLYHLEKTLNLYKNFNCLYDEQYTHDWIEYCVIDTLPSMMMSVIKNSVAVSKIFSNFKDIQEKNITETVNKNSYEGFNASGVFNRNDALVTQNLYNPIRTLLLMDVDFKQTTQEFKKMLEKSLQILY